MIVGAEDEGNRLGIRRQLRAAGLSPFVRQKLGFFISKERRGHLQELRNWSKPAPSGRRRKDVPVEAVPAASAASETAAHAARSSSPSDHRARSDGR